MNATASSRGATIIDGAALAEKYRNEVAQRVADLRARDVVVRLDAILASASGSAARLYAENQGKACAKVGIDYHLHTLPEDASFDDVAGRVLLLNNDDISSAIMVHMPLPESIDPYSVQRLIDPAKDVEGVNPANIGNVVYGRSSLVPCTALAAMTMIESTGVELRGARCVVVGASNIVGKPLAVLLMQREATVISCNKFTQGVPELAREADVLIAAAGVPGLITKDMVKPGAVVVDVGTNRVRDDAGKARTVGDVDFDAVSEVAAWISPVPGGVGPMTVAMLLRNVVEAANR